ncbi:vWA domain-containing protein [Calothrix sp. PCC 6303]|uniref:vWA domain-containing protein n=1 Tax=Calothrix sp. PCC 6303 TaxID=1170562 RepID=UPI0002A034C0|nr:VWA domain-containing protein [Calothrix sp. PCC 6303]AFZ00588.1 von Willebrand factor type A [Calothrix sp. PCC 6303]
MRHILTYCGIAFLVINIIGCEASNKKTSSSVPQSAVNSNPAGSANQGGNVAKTQQEPPLSSSKPKEQGLDSSQEAPNGEKYRSLPENEFQKVSSNPLSTFSIDVDTASYSNIRRFINDGQLPPPEAVRVEEMINYFKYDYAQPAGKQPFAVTTEVATTPWNPQHRLVQIGMKSQNPGIEKLAPNNLVFLLDTSGSMNDADKLPLLKAALRLMVNELRPTDKVSIVAYAGSAGLVLPATPGSAKAKILAALDKLEAGGSTAGGEGIKLAYKIATDNLIKSGNNRVILATDGDFNVGISSDDELVKLIEKQRQSNIYLSVLGFGSGNLQDSKMEQLADKGNGNYAYIDSLLEAKKVLVKELGATLLTVAKDVKIQVEFNPAKIQAYRLIGYENRTLQSQDFNNDKKDAGELGAGHTVTALYEIVPAGINSNAVQGNIDPLKYQNQQITQNAVKSNEIMQVKLRYKPPQTEKSQLLSYAIADQGLQLENASNNLKFAASVTQYAMVLRNSPSKGNTNLDTILKLARQSVGSDLDGYRAEFIRLVEKTKTLQKRV